MPPKDKPTQEKKSGIRAVDAFQTSDGTVHLNHALAKEHEAMIILIETLRTHCDFTDRDVDMIVDNRGFISKTLTTFFGSA